MRVLLIFLLTSVAFTQEFSTPQDSFHLEDGPTAHDFFKGLAETLGEAKDTRELVKCMKNFEEIVGRIFDAVELILNFDFLDVIQGVNDLIAALKELEAVVKPCVKNYPVFTKLISDISNATLNDIMNKILRKKFIFIGYATSAFECFCNDLYECVGRCTGMIFKLLFPSTNLHEDAEGLDAVEFLKGFIEGLGGSFDINKFRTCLKDFQHLYEAIKRAFEALKTKQIGQIIQGVAILIAVAKQLVDDLRVCAQGVEVVRRLIEALANVSAMKVAVKLLMNFTEVYAVIARTAPCFASENYRCIGIGLGMILKLALF
eukprot:TRINITY_DN1615_c0_g5_i1.p1 TRINITY_DN1615_c0_g5~~TRINITY_DN1615_c0_g5_i1.p1  ORF type:complete len:325 (-),score=49.02 TRINITY_DN1615_c0_g5_i1:157-1107(-)